MDLLLVKYREYIYMYTIIVSVKAFYLQNASKKNGIREFCITKTKQNKK